ncbi:G2/M phase-specific E3 ubiquitin-protein ligase-like isoform X2 [Chironomus tepperi]|uniref:G2/M phase-specific E3 ubiquitin-protein ligase-like isoform X2 n=1 Tax=Chironomus tepperi TaxID=113505 RepID=UPI00391F0513
MLFAPGLLQNGSDNDGFGGFLHEDIRAEAIRIRPLRCKYCNKKGANLGCCIRRCPFAYHTHCAIENDLVFEFTSKYHTYCHRHKRIKQTDKKNLEPECGMCYESLTKEYPDAILSPCCKNSWFHKKCMQKFAVTSALLFKCPLCASKKTEEWTKLGIFFPIRDAAWELEENAFQEFYEPIKLSCENKKCKDKCLHAGEMHMWRLCQFCGACGIHEDCFQGSPNDKYTCLGCEEILNRTKTGTASESENHESTDSVKSIGTDHGQEESDDDNKENVSENSKENPKPSAATIFGESDIKSIPLLP